MQSKLSSFQSSNVILRFAQISVLIIFLTLGVAVSLISSEGPDEVAHYYFNRFVAKYGRLPLTTDERLEAGYKADLPPLYYLMTGMAGRGIDLEAPPHLKINRDNPRLQLVTGHGNIKAWRMIKTEDPIRGEILLWYVGRWMALLGSTIALVITYIVVLKANPENPRLALSAVALLAFLPTYNYVSGVASYEPLTGLLVASYFLLLFYVIKYPDRNWLYLALGLLVGLAAAARQTVWVLLPIVPIVIIWLAYRQRWAGRMIILRLALMGMGLILTFGVWVLYIAIYFNQIDELGWFQGLISPVLIGDGSGRTSLQIASMMTNGELGLNDFSRQSDTFLQWIWHFFSGIWGRNWLGWLMVGIWGLAVIGIFRRWRRETESTRLWIILLVVNIGVLLFFPFLRFVFSGQASTAMSQHILFPTAAAIMALFVYGLGGWLTPKYATGLLFVLAAVYLTQSLVAIPNHSNESFPIQTIPQSANEQVIATFDIISLIDYEVVADDRVLKVSLFWRAEEFSNEDYQVAVTLFNHLGQPQSRWVGQPLNGRYPTRAWMPEDRIRHDVYLPIVGLLDGDYQLQLRVLGETGVIPAADGEQISLGSVMLLPSRQVPTNVVTLGDREIGLTLWEDNHPATDPLLYGENATVIVSASERFGDEVQLKLVGPDGRSLAPVDHTGSVYSYSVAPHFASGDYRLRVEQWDGDDLVAQAETPPLLQVKTEARQFEAGPISRPLSANFARYVALLGYDSPQRRVQPGDTVPVTLYWQALRTIGADLVVFNHLVDEEQNQWGGHDRIPREIYSTMLWAPGEIVTDPFELQISTDAPAGIYYLLVGLYLRVGEAAVSLPLIQNNQMSEVTHVRIGPIMVGQTPPDLIVDQAKPQVALNQPFGNAPNLTLLGYDLVEQMDTSEPDVKLTLYWRVESPLEDDYTTFVHLRDDAGQIVAQQDQPPLKGRYPTSLWETGEIVADEINLSFPVNLTVGQYEIVLGLYDATTGERLPISGSVDNDLALKEIEIW